MTQSGNLEPHIVDITFMIPQILGLFAAILVGSIFIVPRITGAKENTLSFRLVQGALKIRKSISDIDDSSTMIMDASSPTMCQSSIVGPLQITKASLTP